MSLRSRAGLHDREAGTHAVTSVRRTIAGFALLLALPLAAADQPSDPTGAFRIRLRGNSDTLVSLPLQRSSLVEAAVNVRAGTTLQLTADIPAIPTEGAFALVMSGSLEGAVLPVSSVSGRTLTLNTDGYDLAPIKSEAANGTGQGDLVAVVPYWSLDTLFPSGAGVNASANGVVRRTEVLLFDDTIVGTQLSASAIFYYFAGTTTSAAGWFRVGASGAQGTTRLPPHRYFIVRNRIETETELVVYGGVQMAGYRIPLHTRQADRDQDNVVALPVPLPTTLSAAGLITSGAFVSSTSDTARADELLVFDNSVVGINKAPAAVYYHVAGHATIATGWYKVGAGTASMNSVALSPGEGCIIRKRATAAAARTVWNGLPPYLQ